MELNIAHFSFLPQFLCPQHIVEAADVEYEDLGLDVSWAAE